MKKYIFLITFLAGFIQIVKCQNGFSLNINTQNLNSHTLYLCYYFGSPNNLKITDSAFINSSKQTISFTQSKKIIDAIRVLYLDNPKNKTEIIINNGSKLNATIDNVNIESISFINSDINTAFQNVKKGILSKEERINQLVQLQNRFPKSIINLFTEFEKFRFQSNANTIEDKDKMVHSFINKINWNDKRIALLPNLYTALNFYTSIYDITPDRYQKNATLLLNKIDTGSNLYPEVLNWFFKNIEFNELKNLESVYVYLAKNYLYPNTNIPARDYGSIKSKASLFTNLPNGSLVPDFILVDSLGTSYQLSTIYPKHPYTLIAFFDPECSHCKEKMPEMSKFFNSKSNVYKITILNVAQEKGWNEFIEKASLQNWLNLKCNDPKREYVNNFNSYSNPNFFLIDSKGMILSKSSNVSTLSKLISNQ